MPEPQTPPPRRSRRRRIVLLVFVAVIGIGALAVRWFTRAENVSALLIDKTRSTLGADLALGAGAHYDYWPQLHLVLPQPSLKSTTSTPLLSAQSLDVVLPWRILWADRVDIERIDLVEPTLDLDALNAWLAAQPASTSAPPDVRFSLQIADGTVTASGKPIAQGVNLEFANADDVAAWLAHVRAAANGGALIPPLNGSAEASVVQIGSARLEGVRVEVHDDSAKTPVRQ